jgi:hypothetical protein
MGASGWLGDDAHDAAPVAMAFVPSQAHAAIAESPAYVQTELPPPQCAAVA